MEDKIISVITEDDAEYPTQIAQVNSIAEQYEVNVEIPEFDATPNDITMDEVVVGQTARDVVETIEIEIEEAVGWAGGDNTRHDSLTGRDEENQHPIRSITGLQTILDRIEELKTIYSDKPNIANYYKWKNASYDEYGYFVSFTDESTIEICNGSDIFGVSVEDAGFVGGQDSFIPRDRSYGLIVTSGIVGVRCELDVNIGDYVVSNTNGYAKKSDSDYGYKVLNKETQDGIEYAVIMLAVQADVTNTIGIEMLDIDKRLDAAETNIISAINAANQAYNKVSEIDTSNQKMSDKVDSALDVVDKVVSDVENLETQVSNSALISAQAKAIAESAATSAESIKNEAVAEANKALADTAELRKEFEERVVEIDTELDNTALELEATKENIEATRKGLQTSIDNISSEVDNTRVDLNNTHDELSLEIDGIASSLSDTDKTVALITQKVDENETSIDNLTTWRDTANITITNIEQKTDENSGSIVILTAWKSEVEDDVESITSIKSQSDANKSSIESLTSWQGTTNESLTSIKQQSDDNKASIDAITDWQGETEESIAKVTQQADNNEASIKSLTEWSGAASQSISSIDQRVKETESSISSLTSWQNDATTSIANIEQKTGTNETKINSLTSWQSEATTAIANVEQKTNDNETAITSLTTWQSEATESIAAVQQTANQNSADISLIATWKLEVEDDISSIASIKTTANENEASIKELVEKDTELSETIAGVKTTADANTASIEQITSWQDKVNPTINSIAGIKQTADDNAAKIEGLTVWQGSANTTMARIEQKADANGAYIQSTVSNMDKYSVGPYSQAYGFTLEQAASVLEEGVIYVPTINKHGDSKETYTYKDIDGATQISSREFTQGYLYQWSILSNGLYGWVTIDKDYNETSEINTSAKAVYFAVDMPTVADNFGYWYTDGDSVTDGYESHTLYKWESYVDENDDVKYHWVAVATLAGNSQNRAVSQIRQDANSIEMRVTDVEGSAAISKQWIDDNSANIQDVVTWKGDNADSIATFMATAEDNFASTSQVAQIVDENGNIKAASIVAAVNGSDASVIIGSDHINLQGYVTMTNLSTSGETTIDGGNITTGTIDADRINVDDLNAFNATIGGWNIGTKGINKTTEKDDSDYIYTVSLNMAENKDTHILSCYTDDYADGGDTGEHFYIRADGYCFFKRGYIGDWDVGENGITKTAGDKEDCLYTVSLNSAKDKDTHILSCYTDDVADGGDTGEHFYVTADGYLYTEKGNIAGFEFDSNGLKKTTSEYSNDYLSLTENKFEITHSSLIAQETAIVGGIPTYIKATRITNGILEVSRSEVLAEMFDENLSFMTVIIQGQKYYLFINTETLTIEIRAEI